MKTPIEELIRQNKIDELDELIEKENDILNRYLHYVFMYGSSECIQYWIQNIDLNAEKQSIFIFFPTLFRNPNEVLEVIISLYEKIEYSFTRRQLSHCFSNLFGETRNDKSNYCQKKYNYLLQQANDEDFSQIVFTLIRNNLFNGVEIILKHKNPIDITYGLRKSEGRHDMNALNFILTKLNSREITLNLDYFHLLIKKLINIDLITLEEAISMYPMVTYNKLPYAGNDQKKIIKKWHQMNKLIEKEMEQGLY